jgi:plasmid stabilization system protein ParE
LKDNFSQKEIDNFYWLLQSFEETVSVFPELYPVAKKVKIRRAVINKVLSIFYRIHHNQIEVIAILDNRCDLNNWI